MFLVKKECVRLKRRDVIIQKFIVNINKQMMNVLLFNRDKCAIVYVVHFWAVSKFLHMRGT